MYGTYGLGGCGDDGYGVGRGPAYGGNRKGL
jgi:hypothetical protein